METDPNQSQNPVPAPGQQLVVSGGPGQVFAPNGTPAGSAGPVLPTPPAPVIGSAADQRPLGVLPTEQIQPQNGFNPQAGGQMSSENSNPPPKKRFSWPKKPALIAIIVVIAVLGGSAAAYFGYYVPNKPENIWRTALSRMGQGYDKLTGYVNNYQQPKGTKIDGNFTLSGAYDADGSISSVNDGSNSKTNMEVAFSGVKLDLDVLSVKSTAGPPDIYLKLNGLDGVAPLLDAYSPDLDKIVTSLNNQWYYVNHTLYEQYLSSSGSSNANFSKADITEVLNALAGPTKKYVFTGDTKNMAFVIKQKIGKEKQDGRSVYHYKIGVNKANLAAYNNAVCDSLKGTKLFRLLSNSSGETQALKECKDTSDIQSIKNSDTADVWVDTHTKLIHKVRFKNKGQPGNYYDIFQDYQGGDDLPFGVIFNSKDSGDTVNGSLKFDLNMATNIVTVKGSLNVTGTDKETGSLNLKWAPNNAPVNIQKPAKYKNILQILSQFGMNGANSGAQTRTKELNSPLNASILQ
ncbi:MAG TPA: hypothetical protein VFW90_00505 [Candidatus Saccharimonadales bacterium]|nr:hypothetical protein [Candidatus Saccharimonadales bacterium]